MGLKGHLRGLMAGLCLVALGCGNGGKAGEDAVSDNATYMAETAELDALTESPLTEKTEIEALTETAAQSFVETEIEATPGFRARQAEYLGVCAGDGASGLYAQVCRLAAGRPLDEAVVDEAIGKVKLREDTADFKVAALLRLLYLDQEGHKLPPSLRQRLEDAIKGFKYWLDQSGKDKMCYWTENHQILFHSAELLAGQLFEDAVFENAGMTGAQHKAHALPWVERWLDNRLRFGFAEWHSNVYFNEDIPALVNLADFAADERIRTKASMVLDVLAFDMLNNYYKGYFATTHGRTYEDHFIGGLKDSTSEAAWLLLGLGSYRSFGNFSGAFIATSKGYVPPPVLEAAAQACLDRHENRQRDGIDVRDGPAYGIGYESLEDIIFWAGAAALVAKEVIEGTVTMLDTYDLWDGFLFGDLPPEVKSLLKDLHQSGQLAEFAAGFEPLSRGIALEGVNTYTFRTPHYQLSGAQDYKPGMWATQVLAWQATLDRDAFVLTSFPTHVKGFDFKGVEFAGDWIGGWLPRVTLHRNIGVIQYRIPDTAGAEAFMDFSYTHAYFPRQSFDEVRQVGHWTFGRKGKGYVALYSQEATRWADGNTYELIADGLRNTWIVELGSEEESGEFDEFVLAVAGAEIEVGERVRYVSPSVGEVEVGWEGPMMVAGKEVDLGPYLRFDNAFGHQAFGDPKLVIEYGGMRLEIDREAASRRYFVVQGGDGE